ncbi:MAG: DUF1361 domain-containing protein [Aureispira sp.]|nr:DUF1361 domain-containing protein [Aureispira sp.]
MIKKTIQHLLAKEYFKLYLILAISLWMSIGLSFFRMGLTSSKTFFFLNWNLFLAFLPFALSVLMFANKERLYQQRLVLLALGCLWLLFFPNAPYIATDLLHLRQRPMIPYWYDVLLLLSFAWNGLLLGFLSLIYIQKMVTEQWGTKIGWGFSAIALVLCSFGIYLGRYLRWNSWDILSDPLGLAQDIADRFLHPFAHPRTIGVTLFFSVFLIVGYLTLYVLSNSSIQRQKIED